MTIICFSGFNFSTADVLVYVIAMIIDVFIPSSAVQLYVDGKLYMSPVRRQ